MKNNRLHIYSQDDPHSDAWICGDKKSLKLLMETIAKVLKNETTSNMNSFTSDGEGFKTFVVMLNENDLEAINLPYTNYEIYYSSGKAPFQILEEKSPGEYSKSYKKAKE